MFIMFYYVYREGLAMINLVTASTCAMPQGLSGLLLEPLFLVTLTVLCGFQVFENLMTRWLWVCELRDVVNDPLR